MRSRHPLPLFAIALLFIALTFSSSGQAWAWSNGGYSSDPSNPDYGTHDWIAEHALEWLPIQEKQFLTDNLAVYLYGTELPDNNQAADGIGDTGKHHIYFFANGSLQDDASAVRARDEYANAVRLYGEGNFGEASKHLGMMAHYVSDLAVYPHVMGAATAWGTEIHHSDYENYIQTRTNSYNDDFSTFLAFDGTLATVLPYEATITLARYSTFDGTAGLSCVWMDQHYNWSDAGFRDRAGESLNLAVNAVADVLHTFYLEALTPNASLTPTLTNSPTPTPIATAFPEPTASPTIPEFSSRSVFIIIILAAFITAACLAKKLIHSNIPIRDFSEKTF